MFWVEHMGMLTNRVGPKLYRSYEYHGTPISELVVVGVLQSRDPRIKISSFRQMFRTTFLVTLACQKNDLDPLKVSEYLQFCMNS